MSSHQMAEAGIHAVAVNPLPGLEALVEIFCNSVKVDAGGS